MKLSVMMAALALLCLGSLAQANINIETVTIGNAGNRPDTTGYGSVSYSYSVGKYEVTAGQYAAFLSAKAGVSDPYGLYSSKMWSDSTHGCQIQRTSVSGGYSYTVASAYASTPVNYVSFWDACRFVNWLNNGQGNGDTEDGAYTIPNGYTSYDGRTIQRNAGSTWAVTSEDEWYKAAYYKAGAYSLYANGTYTAPVAGTASNYSVVHHTWDGTVNGAVEQNGTKDMMGNVWEWNEAVVDVSGPYADRGLRGGSFIYGGILMKSSFRNVGDIPNFEADEIGFRVSRVPEPSSIMASLGGLTGLIGLRRRGKGGRRTPKLD
jgi:formylglycine-generating enzyme